MHDLPTGAPAPPTEFTIARGEQKTIAYWMHNDTSNTVDVDIYLRDIVETHDTFPGWAIDARVLTYRDRVLFTGYEVGDPQWEDADSDGTFSRGDIEDIWDVDLGTDTDPHPLYEIRRGSGDTNASGALRLYQDPEPLPMYGTFGTAIGQDITLAPGEARVLWVVITVPDDMTTGTYYEPPATPGGVGPVNFIVDDGTQSDVYDLDLEIHVPCWDALDQTEPTLWDYSYIPGTPTPEHAGVLATGQLADERARLRTMGGHNAIAVYVGYPSRTPDETGPIQDPFRWIVAGLDYELRRYEDDTSNPEHIDTIVLLMALEAVTLDGDWGTDSELPHADWSARYRQTLIDFEAVFQDPWPDGRNMDLSKYNLVIVPVDEPTSFPVDGSCTHETDPADYRCSLPTAAGRSCWDEHTADMGSVAVTRRHIFRASARVIEDLPTTDAANRWTLVNHNVLEKTRCHELLTQFEDCGSGTGYDNCVDIWMSAGLMVDPSPMQHPFNDGSSMPWADLSTDQFWWYQFDGYGGADEGPMRYAQSGLLMDGLGYTGHSNWAFWAAQNELGSDDEDWVVDPTTVYNRHSWISTNVRLWGQDNTMYLSPTTTHSYYFPQPDATAPADTPTAEALIPGRVLLAKRQAIEYQRLLTLLDNMPDGSGGTLTMTQAAETAFDAMVFQSSRVCHSDGDCDNNEATPEEWSLVARQWLNDAAFEADACTSPDVAYTGSNATVSSALATNPWSTP